MDEVTEVPKAVALLGVGSVVLILLSLTMVCAGLLLSFFPRGDDLGHWVDDKAFYVAVPGIFGGFLALLIFAGAALYVVATR